VSFCRAGALAAYSLLLSACSQYGDSVDQLPEELSKAIEQPAKKLSRAELDEELEIGTISVLNEKVLPPADFFAPLINNLHYVTTRETIAAELNFKSGSKVRRWELYDAERYIRMLDPIKQAKIIATPNKETGKTDITVLTQDRLSAYVRGGGAGSGGYSSFGVQAGETSLFGRLYNVGASYTRENFRDFVGLSAGKQRIAGTRWEISGSSVDGFVGSAHNYTGKGMSISHPFLVDGQRHSFSLSATYIQGISYEYLGGGIRQGLDTATGKSFDLIHRQRVETISAEYLHGIGKKTRIEFGPGFLHYISKDYFVYPEDQYTVGDTKERVVSERSRNFYQYEQYSSRAVSFAVNTRFGDFVPMMNFRRYLFTEDQFEGFRTSARVTHADPAFGLEDHYTKTSAAATYSDNYRQKTFRLEAGIGRTATFWRQRYEIPRDDAWNMDVRFFHFVRYGTLAVRQYVSSGNNMSIGARNQIAGEFTRGFLYGSVTPSAGVLSSVEYRSPALKLPYLLLAGVAFFDYAGVGTGMQNLQWNPIVGLGLRSMLYEFDNNVFRLDIGYNLNDPEFSLLNSLQFGMSHTF